jgi:HNH endonuclease
VTARRPGAKVHVARPAYATTEWLRERYLDDQLAPHEIARLVGCSTSPVHAWLHRDGIPTRSQPESLRLVYAKRGGGPTRLSDGLPIAYRGMAAMHPVLAGRSKAERKYPVPQACEVCGRGPEGVRMHRHHRNEDTQDNSESNIQWLCPACHLTIHSWPARKKDNRDPGTGRWTKVLEEVG